MGLFAVPRYGLNNQVMCIINGILMAKKIGMTPHIPDHLRSKHHMNPNQTSQLSTTNFIDNCPECESPNKTTTYALFGPIDWYAQATGLHFKHIGCNNSLLQCVQNYHRKHPHHHIAINFWRKYMYPLENQKELVNSIKKKDCIGIHLRPMDNGLHNLTIQSPISRFTFHERNKQSKCDVSIEDVVVQLGHFTLDIHLAFPRVWSDGHNFIGVNLSSGDIVEEIRHLAECKIIIGSHSTVLISSRRISEGYYIPLSSFCSSEGWEELRVILGE